MIDANQFRRRLLDDLRVELTEEFDRNFERKAFFTKKWKRRVYPNPKGSLLLVTGTLRRSIRSEVQGSGVRFTSSVPYASIHNEGGKGTQQVRRHTRISRKGKQYTVKAHIRKFNMPQRQFIGDGKRTQELIRGVIEDNVAEFGLQLTKFIRQ